MVPTSLLPLQRKACSGFFRPKNPTASVGCKPANLGTKGQHATSRPPKPQATLLINPFQSNFFLPTAYSPALICFGRERGWWIACNYPTVLKKKNVEKQKEYNLRYLLAKVRTTWGKASDRLRQRAKKREKKHVGRPPTSEQNWKIILSDEVRCRIGKG
jgi:hypothetical protein